MPKKRCRICHHYKELEEHFSKDKSSRDGHQPKCKACAKKLEKERQEKKMEEQKNPAVKAPIPGPNWDIGGGTSVVPNVDVNPDPQKPINGGEIDINIPFATPEQLKEQVAQQVRSTLSKHYVGGQHRVYGVPLPDGIEEGMTAEQVKKVQARKRAEQGQTLAPVTTLKVEYTPPGVYINQVTTETPILRNPLNPFDEKGNSVGEIIDLDLSENLPALVKTTFDPMATHPSPGGGPGNNLNPALTRTPDKFYCSSDCGAEVGGPGRVCAPCLVQALDKFPPSSTPKGEKGENINSPPPGGTPGEGAGEIIDREAKLLEIQLRGQKMLEETKDWAGLGALVEGKLSFPAPSVPSSGDSSVPDPQDPSLLGKPKEALGGPPAPPEAGADPRPALSRPQDQKGIKFISPGRQKLLEKPTVSRRKGYVTNIRSFPYTPTNGPKIFKK